MRWGYICRYKYNLLRHLAQWHIYVKQLNNKQNIKTAFAHLGPDDGAVDAIVTDLDGDLSVWQVGSDERGLNFHMGLFPGVQYVPAGTWPAGMNTFPIIVLKQQGMCADLCMGYETRRLWHTTSQHCWCFSSMMHLFLHSRVRGPGFRDEIC